jgi:hypothetical protein
MAIKRLEDIEREKHNESREKIKKEISEDIGDVLDNVFRKPKKKKNLFYYIIGFLKLIGILILLMTIVNLVLGNIWLLRFFTKSLFFGN